MNSAIIFDSKSSLDFGIRVERCPKFVTGAVEYEKIPVPGRDGNLIRKKEIVTMSNYIQPYEVWFYGPQKNTIVDAKKIANWLLLPVGYVRLEDTYDPDVYRQAVFAGPLDVENWMLERGRATLEFDCKPQRWLKSGERGLPVTSGQILSNEWRPAKPTIEVIGTGAADLQIGGSHIHINNIRNRITINCDIRNAYDTAGGRGNDIVVTDHLWPVLAHGETQISWTGGAQTVIVIPHWWMP